MTSEKTLNDLFVDTLKDIYYAEKQILKALPKMARAAQAQDGKDGFLHHRDETQGHVERLEQVFEIIGKPARGKTCEAIQGIIAEADEIIEEFKGTPALDAGLISSAQGAWCFAAMGRSSSIEEGPNLIKKSSAVISSRPYFARKSANEYAEPFRGRRRSKGRCVPIDRSPQYFDQQVDRVAKSSAGRNANSSAHLNRGSHG